MLERREQDRVPAAVPLSRRTTSRVRPAPAPRLNKRALDWFFDRALPWWAENSWDKQYGGVVEAFDFQGNDAALPFKRLRVTARQAYVFSHAHIMGWSDGLDLAERCVRYLTDETWRGDAFGFPRRLMREGAVLDGTIDLYDHAFALFGFAWHARATGSAHSRDWIYRTMDFIERKLRHPSGRGFIHQLPLEGPRLQNPHMHIAEASLAAFETTGDNRFRDIARETVDLFRGHFFDKESGALYESFTEDLDRVPGPDGAIIEPGHQFEWSWILNALRPHLTVDVAPEIRALNKYAETRGVDPETGAVRDAIYDFEVVLTGGSRTWPNTERLKSAIALQDLDGVSAEPVINEALSVLMYRYLNTTPSGCWMDAFDARARPTAANVPTSTLYHLALAFSELWRIDPAARVR